MKYVKNYIHKINLLIRLYFPRHNAMEQKNYIIHLPCPVPQHYRVFSQGNIGGVPIGRGWR